MTTYVPVGWSALLPLSGKNFNHMGTIYDCAMDDIDIHDHDSEYYSQAAITAKCFSGGALKPDADKIDGKHWDDIIVDYMPVGFCCFWEGALIDVPDNWHECDGTTVNGIVLPDMRGRIPLGAGVVYAALSSGGAASVSSKGGTVTTENHTLTLDEIPEHYHKYMDYNNAAGGAQTRGYASGGSTNAGLVETLTSAHNHATADAGHDHSTYELDLDTFSIIPPYIAKIMICKVA